jgi:hypothetical protein
VFLGEKDNGESVVIDVDGVAVVSISSVLGRLQPIRSWEGSETVLYLVCFLAYALRLAFAKME